MKPSKMIVNIIEEIKIKMIKRMRKNIKINQLINPIIDILRVMKLFQMKLIKKMI